MKRQNGSGTLIKTSTGLYIAKWMFQGKTFTRSTKCYDRLEALQKLNEFVKPFLENNDIAVINNLQAKVKTINDTKTHERIMLSEMFDKYINNLKVSISDSTADVRHSVVNKFVEWCKKHYPAVTYIDQISKTLLTDFFTYISNGRENSTYNNYLVIIRQIVDTVYSKDNVFHAFEKKKVVEKEQRTLTRMEIDFILKACFKTREKILFYTAAYAGLRKSDICTLQWKHIDFSTNVINKLAIKTHKRFIVPIHPKLLELFKSLYGGYSSPEDYVCPELHNLYIKDETAIRKVINRVYVRSQICLDGLKKYGLHIFRHTFCTNCANNGISMPVLMQMLGHTQPSTTLRYYNHFNTVDVQEKISAIM